MSHGAGPTWMCEHGYLNGRGCHDCDPPLLGGMLGVILLGLAVLVAVVAVFLAGRWAVDQLSAAKGSRPAVVAGAWCGTASEAMRMTLAEPAAGELSGELRMGNRVSTVVGQRYPRGLVALRTVGSALRFDLSGALVEDRLRLNVIDDAGDVGRVELQRC